MAAILTAAGWTCKPPAPSDADLRAAAEAGLSIAQAARALGVSRHVIQSWETRNGVRLARGGRKPKGSALADAILARVATGASLAGVARELRVSRRWVSEVVRRARAERQEDGGGARPGEPGRSGSAP